MGVLTKHGRTQTIIYVFCNDSWNWNYVKMSLEQTMLYENVMYCHISCSIRSQIMYSVQSLGTTLSNVYKYPFPTRIYYFNKFSFWMLKRITHILSAVHRWWGSQLAEELRRDNASLESSSGSPGRSHWPGTLHVHGNLSTRGIRIIVYIPLGWIQLMIGWIFWGKWPVSFISSILHISHIMIQLSHMSICFWFSHYLSEALFFFIYRRMVIIFEIV